MDDSHRLLSADTQRSASVQTPALGGWVDPPVRASELASVLAIVLLADLAIFRGEGYAGCAAVAMATPILLLLGAARRKPDPSMALLGVMLWLIGGRLLWEGTPLAAVMGAVLLPLFAMSLAGRRPYILDDLWYTAALVYLGGRGLAIYGRAALNFGRRFAVSNGIVLILPAIVGVAFSLLFLLANPDLVESVSQSLFRALEKIRGWFNGFSPAESLFLFASAWITVGLLRPGFPHSIQSPAAERDTNRPTGRLSETAPQPLYLAWRNTLAVVILIYAVYLGFEFRTLWFRVFPTGFPYSGYAHEGAAWLTIGLALATSILSLIFRGRILFDGRVKRLERLAWIWSLENLVLAVAVYHRLFLYIGFNGLTRMRIVGLYGVSAVVVGFLLVLLKIVRRRDFAWLLQRHLWTLGLAIYLYAITPADFLAMHYNVRRILAGSPAASVQITVQPISAEGLIVLPPLLDCSNRIVSDGVAALLEDRLEEVRSRRATQRHWTSAQIAEMRFLSQFPPLQRTPNRFKNASTRAEAWRRFRAYAYQWY
jgi:hypothetical protein